MRPLTSLADDAAALKRDMPHADVRFFDTGHFALETHCDQIVLAITEFLVTPRTAEEVCTRPLGATPEAFVQEDSPDEIGRAVAGWMKTLG